MNRKRFGIPAAVIAFGSFALHALDLNDDQISDVYATHYGLAAGSTHEDPDFDGQTNSEESAWGTDPFDNTSVFKPVSSQAINDVYDFAILTLAGKRYRFQGRPDLGDGSWSNIDTPFDGDGQIQHLLTSLPITETNTFFWRAVAVPENDADKDQLGAYEEFLLGTSDLLRDSDGDSILDTVEFTNGLNPSINTDADLDDLPDDWERFYGLNPLSAVGDEGKTGNPDNDGLSNFEEFQLRRNPIEHEEIPTGIPAKPINLVTKIHFDGSRTYTWDDVSDNEDYFFITIRSRSGNMVRVADNIPANTTTYHVDAATIEAALHQ